MTLESRGIETHHGMGQFSLKSSPKTCRQRPSVCRPQGFGSGAAGLWPGIRNGVNVAREGSAACEARVMNAQAGFWSAGQS